jgi:hypothetical protein
VSEREEAPPIDPLDCAYVRWLRGYLEQLYRVSGGSITQASYLAECHRSTLWSHCRLTGFKWKAKLSRHPDAVRARTFQTRRRLRAFPGSDQP